MFTISSVLTTLDVLHSIVIAAMAGYVTSFPPSVHSMVVRAYDYPIARIALFASVLFTAFYAPITAIIYGIGIAIVSEDIVKSSRNAAKSGLNESFTTDSDMVKDLRKSLNIQVAKQMSPIEEALEKVKQAEHLLRQNISSKRD
jgi:hypothetical protein